jgi:mycothiol synthase
VNVRRPTPGDAAAVAELVDAYERTYAVPETSADDMRDEWKDLDLEQDAWLLEVDGRLAGYASVFGHGGEILYVDGYVHPELTGRGVGSRIVELTEARSRERGAARIHTGTLQRDERGRELFEQSDYRYVRSFFRMGIELDGEPPEPRIPEGLRLDRYEPADARAVHAAIEEAFEDHWEHEPRSFEAWEARRAGSDRTLWFVVRDGDEIAGAIANDAQRYGAGWIGTVATRRAWRGRGVAQALLLASLREFHRRGERRVSLGVDATSPTGAVRVYERVGMHVVFQADIYEKRLG